MEGAPRPKVRTYVLLGHDDVMGDGLPPRYYRISMGQKGVWLSRRELEQRGGNGREHGGRSSRETCATDREETPCHMGADNIIKNVLPFLALPNN